MLCCVYKTLYQTFTGQNLIFPYFSSRFCSLKKSVKKSKKEGCVIPQESLVYCFPVGMSLYTQQTSV